MTAAPVRLGAWPLAGQEGVFGFQLWAPDAQRVDLLLHDATLPMRRGDDGIHRATASASHGDTYRFLIDGQARVPDPASRWQPEGVDGPSALWRPDHYRWRSDGWQGVAWADMVIYEVHVAAAGGYAALQAQLPALVALGITAIELMPVAQFPGTRNWGYDGVFPYAPAQAYGDPDALKAFIDAAHASGVAVLLDVVYNHFGPQGNLLARYAAPFFRSDRSTPWGEAIDFRQPAVQRFFIDNALMWLREYRFDGLRLDAVHAIADDGFLRRLAAEVHAQVPQAHLVLENEANQAALLRDGFTAQWNDDFHNALHVMLTGEDEGYYAAYAGRAESLLARCLAEGFAWQGEPDLHGVARGEPSGDLSPARFVVFAQNHDQVGNRALGARLAALVPPECLHAALALTVLTPMIPLLFLGEPWQSRAPFLFFTDYQAPLDDAVREGRRREFARFASFSDEEQRARIPDPNAPASFTASQVTMPAADDAAATGWMQRLHALLALRRHYLQPGLAQARSLGSTVLGEGAVQAGWQLPQGQWWIVVNVGPEAVVHALPQATALAPGGEGAVLPARGGLQLRWVAA
ncbi:MAG: Malto-oligosyltrehalose trehalohydrolase [Stenotrophomonas maltophilia]|uniref:Malto-oligosyltrehalose trehalohydrolase n=1 Tax=Stenotrophomonas maltophilia TaxID=40324 RepID=A0A7V8FIV6_STEMA|nr:MAG: Malto-oligosyltrehalose trehalohydrolase [Stenotrophomonas maltophilia]